MAHMVRAILFCSHGECTDVFEAYGWLEELEALACYCGCALQVTSVSDAAEEPRRDSGVELIPVG